MTMKKLLTIIMLSLLACHVHANDPVKQYGKLQVKGAQLCDKKGNPVILRGVSQIGRASCRERV